MILWATRSPTNLAYDTKYFALTWYWNDKIAKIHAYILASRKMAMVFTLLDKDAVWNRNTTEKRRKQKQK